jgi:hypothetical protein
MTRARTACDQSAMAEAGAAMFLGQLQMQALERHQRQQAESFAKLDAIFARVEAMKQEWK